MKGLKEAGVTRRRTREDVLNGADLNWGKKADGRCFTYYWEGERRRYIYRYQVVWIRAYGEIPKGMVIHHIDEDRANDDLSNLQLMTRNGHNSYHMDEEQKRVMVEGKGREYGTKREWVCQTCGATFEKYRRAGSQPRKYCSVTCYRKAQRSMIYR